MVETGLMIAPVQLVLCTGPPGTGKSTLASVAADALDVPVLGWDWAMAGIRGYPELQSVLEASAPERHRAVGWSILWSLAAAQLREGRAVVLDGVAGAREVDGTRALAAEHGVGLRVVVTRCGDRDLHRRRIEGRARGIPGWYELEWEQVLGSLGRWSEPAVGDAYLDAGEEIEANAARSARCSAARRTPVSGLDRVCTPRQRGPSMTDHDKLYIGGEWTAPATKDRIEVISPHTEEVVSSVPEASVADVDKAVAVARETFDRGDWSAAPVEERIAAVQRFSDAYAAKLGDMATIITEEMGSPISFSNLAQAPASWMMLNAFITIAQSYPWEEQRAGVFGDVIVRREPVGVVAGIVPWNVPQFVTMSKLAPRSWPVARSS